MRRIHVSNGEDPHGACIVGIRLILPAVALLAFVVGCGFNDQLTRRGFIGSGDRICSETIIKAYVDSTQAAASGQPRSRPEIIRGLAGGYGSAARRIRALAVTGDDIGMRDQMAKAFATTSRRLDLAARSRGDTEAILAAIQAVAELKPAYRAIRAYGFEKCAAQLRPS